MKRIIVILYVIFVFSMVACTKTDIGEDEQSLVTTEPTISEAVATPSLSISPAPTEGTMTFIPADGEICLTVMNSCFYKPSEQNISALNYYLRDSGYNFYVEFFSGTKLTVEGIETRYDAIVAAEKAGTKVDLLMLSGSREDAADAVERNLVLPLDDFFTNDASDDWWDRVPDKYIETIEIGVGDKRGTYGLFSSEYLRHTSTIVANKSLITDIGIRFPEELTIQEMNVVLEEAVRRGLLEETMIQYPVIMPDVTLHTALGFFNMMNVSGFGVLSKTPSNGLVAVNPFVNDAFRKDLITLYQWREKGWLGFTEDVEGKIEKGNYLFAFSINAGQMNQSSAESIYRSKDVCIDTISECMNATVDMLCIASWSKQPQEAYELMKLLYTDADAANLLYYGQMAEDVKEGSYVHGGINVGGMINHLLLNHVMTEEEKIQYVASLEDATSIPCLVDGAILSGERNADDYELSKSKAMLQMNIKELFKNSETQEDFEKLLDEYQTIVEKDTLYQEMIASWNKQLSEDE